jgi:hypothetical protein
MRTYIVRLRPGFEQCRADAYARVHGIVRRIRMPLRMNIWTLRARGIPASEITGLGERPVKHLTLPFAEQASAKGAGQRNIFSQLPLTKSDYVSAREGYPGDQKAAWPAPQPRGRVRGRGVPRRRSPSTPSRRSTGRRMLTNNSLEHIAPDPALVSVCSQMATPP